MLLKEIKTSLKLSSDYFIQYFDVWIERNNYLYIQMELCSDNLQNIIQQKPEFFGREESEPMKEIEYFISCQILKELSECVQYLHESNPPVIHGNLKPENILFCDFPRSGRHLKLCDIKIKSNIKIVGTPEEIISCSDQDEDITNLLRIFFKMIDVDK